MSYTNICIVIVIVITHHADLESKFSKYLVGMKYFSMNFIFYELKKCFLGKILS